MMMRNLSLKDYGWLLLWIAVYLGVSFAIGQVTQSGMGSWYAGLEKPFFNPPSWVFPPVWILLYIMIATAGWYIWIVCKGLKPILKYFFVLYTVLNWSWTPLFFGIQEVMAAFVVIVFLNLVACLFIYRAWGVARPAAYLMLAPLVWTLFAAVLNVSIWWLNRPF